MHVTRDHRHTTEVTNTEPRPLVLHHDNISTPHSMTSTVVFPAHASDPIESMSSVSVISRQTTALEICDMVYGNKTPSWEAIEHYYEPSASEPSVLTPPL